MKLITNVWGALQEEELVNLYQFLYHVTPVVVFQMKSWSDPVFCWFCRLEISFNSIKK